MSYALSRSAFGEAGETPFDLNDLDSIIELKLALRALAMHLADPLKNPADPIIEERWKKIDTTSSYRGGWEGPSADEFVTAISRHAPSSGISGPYAQLNAGGFGKYGIVGGPFPTAAGLEVIAGAVQTLLGGQPRMSKYLAWRDGVFDPPSTVSGPPTNAVVIGSKKRTPIWQKDGYTQVWVDGDPQWVDIVAQLDDSLVSCWQQSQTMLNETTRDLALRDCILSVRASRDLAVRKANKGVPPPECPQDHVYDADAGECKKMSGVIDLPEVTPTDEMCIQAYRDMGKSKREARELCHVPSPPVLSTVGGALAIGAVVGVGFWFLQKRRASATRRA